jgi:hypothetical protein
LIPLLVVFPKGSRVVKLVDTRCINGPGVYGLDAADDFLGEKPVSAGIDLGSAALIWSTLSLLIFSSMSGVSTVIDLPEAGWDSGGYGVEDRPVGGQPDGWFDPVSFDETVTFRPRFAFSISS